MQTGGNLLAKLSDAAILKMSLSGGTKRVQTCAAWRGLLVILVIIHIYTPVRLLYILNRPPLIEK